MSQSSGTILGYNITYLNLEITRLLRMNDDNEDAITIQTNYNILKSLIILADDYKIDFTVKKVLRGILGFDRGILEEDGAHDSQRQVNITNMHSVLI